MTKNNLAGVCVNAGITSALVVMSYGFISGIMYGEISNFEIFFWYAIYPLLLCYAGYYIVKTIEMTNNNLAGACVSADIVRNVLIAMSYGFISGFIYDEINIFKIFYWYVMYPLLLGCISYFIVKTIEALKK
jgi:hypothetical protein